MEEEKNIRLNWQAFPMALIVLAVFLVIGFVAHIWHPTWLVFFAIPLYHWGVDLVQHKRIRGLPVFISVIVSIAIFLALGFALKVWHPTWLVFLLIPITASMTAFIHGGIRGQVHRAAKKIEESIIYDDDDDDGETGKRVD